MLEVQSRRDRGVSNARSRHARAAAEARSRSSRGTPVVRRGMLAVRSRFGRSAVEVC